MSLLPTPNAESVGVFLRHLEPIFAALGLVLIGAGAIVLHDRVESPWLWCTLLATGIGVTQVLLLWAIRSRQRIARDQIICEVQTMLQDVINNQLVVIQMADQINRRKPGAVPESAVERSVGVIYEAVASLSHDSLHAWTQKYRQAARRRDPEAWLSPQTKGAPMREKLDQILPPERADGSPGSSSVLHSDIREVVQNHDAERSAAASISETPAAEKLGK